MEMKSLPRAADMPGRVLADAFDPEVAGRFNDATVATLERDRPQEDVVVYTVVIRGKGPFTVEIEEVTDAVKNAEAEAHHGRRGS